MTKQATATTKPQLTTIGDQIHHTAGKVTITLQWVRTGAYTVTCYQGELRLDNWCRAYTTELEARAAARHAALAFAAHGDERGIAIRRARLAAITAEQLSRAGRRMHTRGALEAAEAEYDGLLSLHDLAELARMRAGLGAA